MARNCTLAALVLGTLLSAVLSGQDFAFPIAPTTPIPPGGSPIPTNTAPVPGVPTVPAPPTLAPSIPNAVNPGIQFPRVIPPQPGRVAHLPTREAYTGPAKFSLDDGTTLTGEIHADSPLECAASFGVIAVPFNKIRGISWRDPSDGQRPQDVPATLVLDNNDTLTVNVRTHGITLKTAWGQANIELHHVRSLLLTTDKVRWAETPDGRRVLAPESDAPPAPPLPQ
jgi:hypothetical protein